MHSLFIKRIREQLMRAARYKNISNLLIIFTIIILLLGLVMVMFVNSTLKSLKHDASIINYTGVVRGSIQRLTKIVLSDVSVDDAEIQITIENLLNQFLKEENYEMGSTKLVHEKLVELNKNWLVLKDLLLKYKISSPGSLKREIIKISEICWINADSVVYSMQISNEKKVGNIRLFYFILALYGINTLIILYLIFNYVRKKLEYDSSHDQLTNLFNRRYYDKIINYELNQCDRFHRKMSLILFDIDFFKEVNDHFGHKVGDKVLNHLALIVSDSVRNNDTIFRIGGEEFVIICPMTDQKGAFDLAEKIRKRVKHSDLGISEKVTLSLGVMEYEHGISAAQIFKNVDSAMYSAKANGRNRTEIFKGKKKRSI